MSEVATYRVYLSSTLSDLVEEREAVKKALVDRGCAVIQSYGASEQDLIATCREDVGTCDVYVGIFGLRYGYVPPGDNPDGKSITELELDAAVAGNLQVFAFLKDENAKGYRKIDIDAGAAEQQVRDLRGRVGSGATIVPFLFADSDQLRVEVTAKVAKFRSRRQPPPLLDNRKPHPAELRHDVGLVLVPGTDDAFRQELAPLGGRERFLLIEGSPADPQYLKNLDENARLCRSLVFVLSPASLDRFKAVPDLLEMATCRLGARFGGRAALLLGGLAPDQLPEGVFDETTMAAAGEKTADALERCYQAWRARSPPAAAEGVIPVPCVVLAPTADEIAALCDAGAAIFGAYADPDEQTARKGQMQRLFAAIRGQFPAWPQGFYGARREDWRPFGLGQSSIRELLERAFARAGDDGRRSGRERSLLAGHGGRIEIRPYSFDEWLDDRFGSRRRMENLRDRGCLVLVDELALLHPGLRAEGNGFLAGEQMAVISANPCDPAHVALGQLFGDLSFLRIGTLRERYRDFQDPRCELAVGNVLRFERWLRLVVPEMVALLGQVEAEPQLRSRMADFLVGQAP